MSTIFKFIFELAIDPLGLPINVLEEYVLLALIGFFSYIISFKLVGIFYSDGSIIGKNTGSFLHWLIRFITFFILWAITYWSIKACNFILAHWIAVIIASCVLVAILISCVVAFKYYKKNKKNYISL